MAVGTGGTNANNSLSALKFLPGYASGMAPADVATISQAILNDQDNIHPIMAPDSFSYNGQLFVPNRGWLKILPDDVVMVDTTTGWPILLSAYAIASGPWTFAPG